MRRASSAREEHHEHLVADDEGPLPSDRAVGLVFTTAATVIGLVPLLRGRHPRTWALAVAAALLVVVLARPRWLRPLNRAWMAFGLVANMIVTWALMALIFYGVITPLAWARRRLGHDPLRLRFEAPTTTYWLERRPPGPSTETMKNQF